MADYISRDYTVENMENYPWDTEHDKNAAIHLVRELVPAADVVARDCYDRILAENDTMRKQLAQIGKKPGDKMDDVRPVPEGGIGEMSDGYHTFNGLYYQRMVLFASLVNAHQDKAWKSWKHEDGKPCFDGGWFIVGIDTPQGSYTYHYEDKYWNWFECEELPVAKHWDGHTEEDVTRLMSLGVRPVVKATWKRIDYKPCGHDYKCSSCGWKNDMKTRFCPNCGADMRGGKNGQIGEKDNG